MSEIVLGAKQVRETKCPRNDRLLKKLLVFFRSDDGEVLCVTDWGSRNLSFYLATGKQVQIK